MQARFLGGLAPRSTALGAQVPAHYACADTGADSRTHVNANAGTNGVANAASNACTCRLRRHALWSLAPV